MLVVKRIKLNCVIIQLDLNTIKKYRNELNGACGLSLVYLKIRWTYSS